MDSSNRVVSKTFNKKKKPEGDPADDPSLFGGKAGGKGIAIPSAHVPDDDMVFDDVTKSRILISCLFALLVGNMMMLNVAVLVPPFIDGRTEAGKENPADGWEGEPPTEFDKSLIISIFFLAQIVFAPINATIKNTLGSKNTILLGFILMTATTFGLGMIAAFHNTESFKYTALVLRFF